MRIRDLKSFKSALQISIFYFIFGVLWIYFSDNAVEIFSSKNLHRLTLLQNYKGWFFIVITSLLLFVLSYRFFHKQYIEYIQHINEQKAAHIKLTQKDALLQAIINSSPDAIFVKDLEGKYLLFNIGASNLIGVSPEKVIGNTDLLIFSPEATNQLQIIDCSIALDAKIVNYEEHLITASGMEKYFWVTKGPIFTEEGELYAIFGISRDITERKKMEVALQESETFLKQSQSNAGIGSYSLDLKIMLWKSSDTLDELFGIDHYYAHSLIGWLNLIHPDDRVEIFRYFQQYVITQHQKFDREYRIIRHNDQAVRWVNGLGKLEFDDANIPLKMIGTIQDITERKEYENSIKQQQEEFETIFNTSKDGIAVLDMESNFLDFNEAYLEMTGFSREELLTTSCIALSIPEDRERSMEAMKTTVTTGFLIGFEKTCIAKDGKRISINMTATVLPDKKRILITTKDITENKEHEQKLIHMAHYDMLTELPNRVLNSDRLRQAMIQAGRRNEQIAVLYLDLDGFKEVNDLYGHAVGDKLLIALSAHMKEALREGDTLSRLGGDEFVAILVGMNNTSIALPIIKRLLDAASQIINVDDISVQVSASIGATFYPQYDDVDADQLIRQADQAMYEAKQSGKNRYHIFDAEHDRTIRTLHENLERIQQALANNEFILYYQPKVNMRTGNLIGAEALIRWQHPEEGIIPPLEFLPIIENHPLAVEIGEWVINEAIFQIEQWQELGLNLSVSVNVGARQLLQGDFVERLQFILAKHENFDSSLLEIEVLETSALEDVVRASQVIEECKTLGIYFALDDFGTGYSSLTYLRRLPIKTLKIDQSFVRGMLDDYDDLAILEGIIGLASAFGREVIAEGVETHEHGKKMLLLGCELAQGYGIARPMPPEKLIEWTQKWNHDHIWVV